MTPKAESPDYSGTLNLPRTDFPMKADLPKREPEMLAFWDKLGLYEALQKRQAKRPKAFVLHDGPPYANGAIHIGHALNKILKDMTVKTRSLMGFRTPYVPGWDCHGLPIETALLKETRKTKRDVLADVPAFRRLCREFAEKFIALQREEFKRLDVLGDWPRPYTTMTPAYEAGVLRAFRELWAKGYIYKGVKSVCWCFHCETALAEAEVEYKEKTSPSVYVALPVTGSTALRKKGLEDGAEVLVWTTTPWTLPANKAVAFHPDLEYVLAETRLPKEDKPRRLLLAKSRLAAVLSELGASEPKELGRWLGRELAPRQDERRDRVNLECRAPYDFDDGRSVSVLADYVSEEDGTGVVHTAPGHGADDFETGQWYQLRIFSPVDGAGRFTIQALPFQGLRVFPEGNERVIDDLKGRRLLLHSGEIRHSYPHCWRCKNPTIFRATDQWFLKVDHEGLRDKLLKAAGEAGWVPEEGRGRISAMLLNRPDWCISRQRFWGIPIPVLYCDSCGRPRMEPEVLRAIEERVGREGTDFWFQDYGRKVYWVARRAPGDEAAAQGGLVWEMGFEAECANQACEGGRTYRRETDILDVWVDSGASWRGVLEPLGQAPCDLYLEGSDQHRGWFQSSLVLSTALTGHAPYRTVLTHGFVLDEHGRAMHKSLGNVVSPQEVIRKLGADVLRLWVALADYSDDVRLSDKLLEGPSEAYRKLRNTLRYLLGNTFDYVPDKAVAFSKLPELERYMLGRLGSLQREVLSAYERYQYRAAARSLNDFCAFDLSAFYLDVLKDRLYTFPADDPARRAGQTVMAECLERLCLLLSPILSFTAEEAWRQGPGRWGRGESVFLADLTPAPDQWDDPELGKRWADVLKVRETSLKALEEARAAKRIGSSLQAQVVLKGAAPAGVPWPEVLLVSEVRSEGGGGEVSVEVRSASGTKCARCWRYQTDVGSDPRRPGLCGRCSRHLA